MYLANELAMNIRQLSSPAWGVLTAIAISGCCGGEAHQIRIAAPDLFTVQVGNNTLLMYSNTSLSSPPVSSSKLEFIFSTLGGSTGGEGIVLPVRGHEATTPQAMMLSVALPVALRVGDVYTVSRTFTNDPTVGDDVSSGPYNLVQSNQAEVAFNISNSTFPPPSPDPVTYRATTTTGSIRVTNRQRDQVELMLDLDFTDANGIPASVTGRLVASNERTSGQCN